MDPGVHLRRFAATHLHVAKCKHSSAFSCNRIPNPMNRRRFVHVAQKPQCCCSGEGRLPEPRHRMHRDLPGAPSAGAHDPVGKGDRAPNWLQPHFCGQGFNSNCCLLSLRTTENVDDCRSQQIQAHLPIGMLGPRGSNCRSCDCICCTHLSPVHVKTPWVSHLLSAVAPRNCLQSAPLKCWK